MNSELRHLLELQHVDKEIAALRTEIAALPKHVQQIEAKLAKANKRLEEVRAAIKANDKLRRDKEQDIQSENTKIIKFKEQSSSVKTNEQYRALLQEISFAEQKIGSHEDAILEAMVGLEALQADLKAAEAEFKADSEIVEREKKEASARTAVTEKQLAEATTKRNGIRENVSDRMLQQYDRVLKARGSGIAEARDQRCMGCQVMLRAQVFNNVLGGELETCDSCSRILYVDPANTVVKKVEVEPTAPAHREWMFLPRLGTSGAFAVLINAKGNATLKAYDAVTGAALEKRTEKNTTFQHAFAELLTDARNLFVDEANLEDKFKDQLPEEILLDLKHQIPDPARQQQ